MLHGYNVSIVYIKQKTVIQKTDIAKNRWKTLEKMLKQDFTLQIMNYK